MPTYVMRDGELVEKHLAEPLHGSSQSSAYIHSDEMNPTRNHADGKVYTSKSRFRDAVHAHGCRIVGNDKIAPRQAIQAPRAGQDIKRAIEQLQSR